MTTQNFLNQLSAHPNKELVFAYNQSNQVPSPYHITEVKSAHIDSVDCGGNMHSYDETVVQLWISPKDQPGKGMTGRKALKIFEIVGRKKALLPDTEIFFEFGYQDLNTSVYRVDQLTTSEDKILVNMSVPGTVCKPQLAIQGTGTSGGCC